MSFDPSTLKPWIESAGAALTALKSLKDLLPHGPKRAEAERLLREAEDAMKRADAKLADDLGFTLCTRCWPPEIMLMGKDDLLRCRVCGLGLPVPKFPTSPPSGPSPMRWH